MVPLLPVGAAAAGVSLGEDDVHLLPRVKPQHPQWNNSILSQLFYCWRLEQPCVGPWNPTWGLGCSGDVLWHIHNNFSQWYACTTGYMRLRIEPLITLLPGYYSRFRTYNAQAHSDLFALSSIFKTSVSLSVLFWNPSVYTGLLWVLSL